MKTDSKVTEKAAAKRSKRGVWIRDTIGVLYVVDGLVQFSEDFDHIANGVLRLLEISEEKLCELVEVWVENAYASHGHLPSQLTNEQRIESLQKTVLEVLPVVGAHPLSLNDAAKWGKDLFGNHADTIYARSISGNVSRAVVGNSKTGFAWLIDPLTNAAIDPRSIVYDTAYYSDRPDRHYGPKQYLQDAGWRIQKSRRHVNRVLETAGERGQRWLANPAQVSALDIGSATGMLRAAFAEKGFSHYGIEPSADAIEHCKNTLGFETWQGFIFDLEKHAGADQKFNIITILDVIEHLDHINEAIQSIQKFLTDDGVIVIRTPNLECLDATILGDHYYSYKLDHTSYFSVRSMDTFLETLEMESIHTETFSHVLRGFLGVQCLHDSNQGMRGADMFVVSARKGSK